MIRIAGSMIGDKVAQIIEPAMRIIAGPAVQLGLDLQDPALSGVQPRQPRLTSIHQRPPGLPLHLLPACWPPFAMCTPPAGPDYYGAFAPSRAPGGRCAYPAIADGARAAGPARDGSRVH